MRDRLRQLASAGGLGYDATNCEVGFDGQPPPFAGEWFVMVHPGEWSGRDIEGLEESIGCQVTVTVRSAKVPRDRQGTNALTGPTGQSLDARLEAIRALLHLDYGMVDLANATITASANGFVEPLRFRDGGKPEPKGPEWFHADLEGGSPPVGLAQTLAFGGAVRIQTKESET